MVTYQPTSWREVAEQVAQEEAVQPTDTAVQPTDTAAQPEESLNGVAVEAGDDPGVVLPKQVSLILEAAMAGVHAPAGRSGAEGRTYTNMGVIVGQIEAVRRRRDDRHVTTRSAQGDQRLAYHLTVNDVASDDESVSTTRYRFPIGMSTEMHTRYRHLLEDGKRVILVGPVMFERSYDPGLRQTRDMLDPGMPVWNVRIEVLTIEEAPDDLADFGKVVFEGEVAREARYIRRLSGPGGTMDTYAEVLLRDRRIMKSASGVPRPVVTTLPVEVLVMPEMEIIPGSDALLIQGSRVRIEGHLGMRMIRRNPRRNKVVHTVLGRVAEDLRQRNADAAERLAAYRAETADVPRGQRTGYSGPQPLDAATLERRIGFAQRNVVEQELVQIEVGAITVITQRATLDDAQRADVITRGLERSRRRGTTGSPAEEAPRATERERQATLDTETAAVLGPAQTEAEPDGAVAKRPRRRPAAMEEPQGGSVAAAGDGEDARQTASDLDGEDARQTASDLADDAAGDE